METDKLTVSVSEAVKLSGLGEEKIREWLARGMPHIQSVGGGKTHIPVVVLEQWIEQEAQAQAGISAS